MIWHPEDWGTLFKPEHAGWTWKLLSSLYSDTGRPYHNLGHIFACLRQLDEMAFATPLPVARLALYFHDAVYVPGCPDNERLSANLLHGLEGTLKDPGLIATADVCILATAHKANANLGMDVVALVVDIDLSILGASATDYRGYVQDVRLEFAHVGDDTWHAGRGAFLDGMLAREHIYRLPWMRDRYEAAARRNMQAERAALATTEPR
jgi:predicted metal-dependent HD superfamily phosphohydrolase